MATMYLVQAFKQIGRKLVADPVQTSKTAEKAVATADGLARIRAGVIAFSKKSTWKPTLMTSRGCC